jgi:G3E family GTPase
MARPPLPLTVIGGFLGSGKTTLLNRWLRAAGGRRLAVLVNDFGALNIDAQLIEASTGDVIALTNGCVCCQIGDDLGAALIRVLDAPTPFDAVVIEASGVSDPARIGRYGRATPDLVLDGVIVLVDAVAFAAQAADPLLADTLQRQVAGADLLVLNKSDLATSAQVIAARERLQAWAPEVPQVSATEGAVAPALLSSSGLDPLIATAPDRPGTRVALEGAGAAPPPPGDMSGSPSGREPARRIGRPGVLNAGAVQHGSMFETWFHRPRAKLSSAALDRLLRTMPRGVLRLKGVVETDTLGWVELQYASGRGRLRPISPGAFPEAALVAIGLAGCLPRTELDAALAYLGPEGVHEGLRGPGPLPAARTGS